MPAWLPLVVLTRRPFRPAAADATALLVAERSAVLLMTRAGRTALHSAFATRTGSARLAVEQSVRIIARCLTGSPPFSRRLVLHVGRARVQAQIHTFPTDIAARETTPAFRTVFRHTFVRPFPPLVSRGPPPPDSDTSHAGPLR